MDDTAIPWSRVAAFVRQYTHDVRNGLNSQDLEIELLQELVPADGEASDCVKRMRKQLRATTQQLRSLSAFFQEPSPMVARIPAGVLLKIWKEKQSSLVPSPEIHWVEELGDEEVNVDVELVAQVFRELLNNAVTHSPNPPFTISGRVTDGLVVFELTEPKKNALDTSTWGQAFTSTSRGRYGLGLWNARRLMQSSGVSFGQAYDAEGGCLKSRLSVPVA